jgi:transglutaminase-like putative cysteine protease
MSDPIQYRATHTTRYVYGQPVSECLSEAHLTPRSTSRQRLIDFHLQIDPVPAMLDRRRDYFGNEVHAIAISQTHQRFVITAVSTVEMRLPEAAALPRISWEQTRALLAEHPDEETLAAYEFTFESPFVTVLPELTDWVQPSFQPGRPLVEAVQELSCRVHDEFVYRPKSTTIDMPLAEVFKNRQGVCQDFAHILIGALRPCGLAARYVSGYLRSGAEYQGAEASHAWVSVFVPGYGWLDLDPTNNVIPAQGHVTVAVGRDYGDVTPVKGVALGGAAQTVEVEVKVLRIEAPHEPATTM